MAKFTITTGKASNKANKAQAEKAKELESFLSWEALAGLKQAQKQVIKLPWELNLRASGSITVNKDGEVIRVNNPVFWAHMAKCDVEIACYCEPGHVIDAAPATSGELVIETISVEGESPLKMEIINEKEAKAGATPRYCLKPRVMPRLVSFKGKTPRHVFDVDKLSSNLADIAESIALRDGTAFKQSEAKAEAKAEVKQDDEDAE